MARERRVPTSAMAGSRKVALEAITAGDPVKEPVKKASAIVAELMVSFGVGYAVQAERECPVQGDLPVGELPEDPPAINPPKVFGDVAVLQRFQLLLLAGCIKNRKELPWGPQDRKRRFILKMAFLHGMFARLLVTTSGNKQITPKVLKDSLDIVQTWCSGGGGGGPACPFKLPPVREDRTRRR